MHDKGKKLIIFFICRRSFSFLHINPPKKKLENICTVTGLTKRAGSYKIKEKNSDIYLESHCP
jgi:hypothetical protein